MADGKSCENTQTPPLKKFCLLDDEIVSGVIKKIKSHYDKSPPRHCGRFFGGFAVRNRRIRVVFVIRLRSCLLDWNKMKKIGNNKIIRSAVRLCVEKVIVRKRTLVWRLFSQNYLFILSEKLLNYRIWRSLCSDRGSRRKLYCCIFNFFVCLF